MSPEHGQEPSAPLTSFGPHVVFQLFGTPTDEGTRTFTQVLQRHIAIDMAIFPTGITGYMMGPFCESHKFTQLIRWCIVAG